MTSYIDELSCFVNLEALESSWLEDASDSILTSFGRSVTGVVSTGFIYEVFSGEKWEAERFMF
jgi:hypothetical protein